MILRGHSSGKRSLSMQAAGNQGGRSPRSLAQVQRARRLLQALAETKERIMNEGGNSGSERKDHLWTKKR